MIQAFPTAESIARGNTGCAFVTTLARFVGPVPAYKARFIMQDALVGTGTYQALTTHVPLADWGRQNLAVKALTVITHTSAATLQLAIWVPLGAGAVMFSCALVVMGRTQSARDALTLFYLPASVTLWLAEITVTTAITILFAHWAHTLLQRR